MLVVGYGLAVATQAIVFPFFDLPPSRQQNLAIGGIFTAVSLARSYLLRRLFERLPGGAGTPRRSGGVGFCLTHEACTTARRHARVDAAIITE
jgi:hypothetical protein